MDPGTHFNSLNIFSRRHAFLWSFAPFLALFAVFFLFPVLHLFYQGLASSTSASAVPEGYLWSVSAFTYWQALLSTLLSLLLGGMGAILFFETRSSFWPRLSRLSLVCFSLPSLLVVLGILAVWGRSGLWNEWVDRGGPLGIDIYGVSGIVLANAFFNFPLFLLGIGFGLRGLDRRGELTSIAFGASRTRTFFAVTLPGLWPSLRSALVLCFLYSSATSFVVALFLGGGPRATTLEVAIFQAVKMEFDSALAARLSLISLGVSLALYFLLLRKEWNSPGRDDLSAEIVPLYGPRRILSKILVRGFCILLFFAAIGAPLMALIWEGLLAWPIMEFSPLLMSSLISLKLAAMTGLIAVPMGLAFVYGEKYLAPSLGRTVFGFLPSLPLAASSLILSVGILTAYPEWLASHRGDLWPVALVQAVTALPLVHRSLRDALFRVPLSLYQTAQGFGATPFDVFRRVEIPLMAPALTSALLLAVGVSLGEVASVLLFSPGELSTLAVELFRSMGRYNFSEGYGYGFALLLLLSFVVGFTLRTSRESKS